MPPWHVLCGVWWLFSERPGLVKFGLRQARGVDIRVASDHGNVQVIEALLGRRGV